MPSWCPGVIIIKAVTVLGSMMWQRLPYAEMCRVDAHSIKTQDLNVNRFSDSAVSFSIVLYKGDMSYNVSST